MEYIDLHSLDPMSVYNKNGFVQLISPKMISVQAAIDGRTCQLYIYLVS